jgi:hypothetical protein
MTSASAPNAGQKKAELLLRKLLYENPAISDLNGWASERARWAELAYLLTSRLVAEDHPTMRQAIGTASALGLLEIGDLAVEPPAKERDEQIGLILEEHGLSEAESAAVIITLHEIAKQIHESLGGYLHRFLRVHAEQMLHELTTHFRMTHVNECQAQQAFVMWLQNTCNLPISLEDAKTLEFCAIHEISDQELFDAADAIQLNFALVDDLVALHKPHSTQEAIDG